MLDHRYRHKCSTWNICAEIKSALESVLGSVLRLRGFYLAFYSENIDIYGYECYNVDN